MNRLRKKRLPILVWALCAIGLGHPVAGHANRSVSVLCVESDGRMHVESADAGSRKDCLAGSEPERAGDVRPASVRPTVPGSCERCVDLSLSCLENDPTVCTRGGRIRSVHTPPPSPGVHHVEGLAVDGPLTPTSARERPISCPSYDASSTVLQI